MTNAASSRSPTVRWRPRTGPGKLRRSFRYGVSARSKFRNQAVWSAGLIKPSQLQVRVPPVGGRPDPDEWAATPPSGPLLGCLRDGFHGGDGQGPLAPPDDVDVNDGIAEVPDDPHGVRVQAAVNVRGKPAPVRLSFRYRVVASDSTSTPSTGPDRGALAAISAVSLIGTTALAAWTAHTRP